ncbi:cytochrome P450 [Amycolatopsis regifaucium]|uniref:Cytochrome n=1 Tax=Amycolatopsis regifaucium TaxID=546365 RepID=A0A154MRJ2_9PSEU|nr:cytochrome P450 [Amycolatopsis regifaucium]KZB86914.1 cytochrome [Amycolatopsis regifaucium]OKA09344.1 cytochrome [Amycolatopsis regifaucium]SFH58894.1 Cytochrome P450 [Amycolatopsis regifaucium]
MTKSVPHLAELPLERPPGCPFDPPAELASLRDEHPLVRLTFPDGHEGWLATGYSIVRSIVADPRFSARQELIHSPLPGPAAMVTPPPAAPGMFIKMDDPEHGRYRKLLTGKFTVRRMRLLTERVEQVVTEHLDAMERQGSPADLVAAFAQPIPALMICELLGVPYADHEFFRRNVAPLNKPDAPLAEQEEAINALGEYLYRLIVAKRAEPTDDILGELVTTELTDEELTSIAFLLLGAGLDTTANMLALGTFALLRHPDQLRALREDPESLEGAIEELLRYLTIAHTGARTALEDVEVGGQLIKAGQAVALSAGAANRDPLKFPEPDRLDLRRNAAGHAAFGHGVHQCLGQQLARVQMKVAFAGLLARFPSLRLAVPADEVPLRTDSDIYGVYALPVAWD